MLCKARRSPPIGDADAFDAAIFLREEISVLVRRNRDLGRRRATATRNRDSFTRGRDDVLHLARPAIPLANA